MRKLALSDEILLKVEKPARYIGNEINMVKKNPENVDVRFAMCFPDVYEIGMSHLGIQILYEMFNRRDDVYCERVYSPWPDLDKIMREEDIPLFALESQDPVKDFDFLGITIQYEMCYTNILQVLDLSKIALLAKDREEDDPIVIGGGPCTYNGEPIAPFFDLFYIGEGEVSHYALLDLYKECKAKGLSRKEFLVKASSIPGIYAPALYNISYNEDGTVRSINNINKYMVYHNDANLEATSDDVNSLKENKNDVSSNLKLSAEDFDGFSLDIKDYPNLTKEDFDKISDKVRKVIETNMDDTFYPTKPLVPYIKVTQDRVVLEIMRGCIRGCRFCQAGMVYRPVRERSLEHLKKTAYEMLKSTGHEEISLSSLSSSDYRDLEGLVTFLVDEFKGKGVNVSLPSLRIDAFSLDVMSKVQDVKKSSLTFAPEGGSQRIRDVINKGLTEEVILKGAGMAFESGWNKVKLYFMLGLPTETVDDMKGIAHLSEKIAERYYEIPKDQRIGKVQVTASTSFFVPKPFTPFQWASMNRKEEFLGKAKIVNDEMKAMLNKKSLRYNWHEADVSVLEGLLARGDRKVAKCILKAYEKGCIFDAWSDFYDNTRWDEAIEETGIDMDFYISRERDVEEVLPWDMLDVGVSKEFYKREWLKAKSEEITNNCRDKCQGCGITVFKSGVYCPGSLDK